MASWQAFHYVDRYDGTLIFRRSVGGLVRCANAGDGGWIWKIFETLSLQSPIVKCLPSDRQALSNLRLIMKPISALIAFFFFFC